MQMGVASSVTEYTVLPVATSTHTSFLSRPQVTISDEGTGDGVLLLLLLLLLLVPWLVGVVGVLLPEGNKRIPVTCLL